VEARVKVGLMGKEGFSEEEGMSVEE